MDNNVNKKEELYYKDPSLSIACPYPYSHAVIQIEKVLPVGFSVNSTAPLKNCTTNRDCGRGFYCGNTFNPSFDVDDLSIPTLDRSDDGSPIKFCYRGPDFGYRYAFSSDRSKVGLPICNKDSQCHGIWETCNYYREHDKLLGPRGIGMCAKSLPYSNEAYDMEKTLPVGYEHHSRYSLKECERNGHCGVGFYCGFSIKYLSNEMDLYGVFNLKFCYKDPNFGKKHHIAFNAFKSGLPKCKTDFECRGVWEICYKYGICVKAYPYSHATIEMEKEFPVDFSITSYILNNCTINGDCGEGFYCGNSVNPLINGAPRGFTYVDKSNGGLIMKFCYKDPNFGRKYNVAFNASKIGLPICNKNSECLGVWEVCYLYGESDNSLKADDESTGRGVCAKAYPYSHATIEIDKDLPIGFSFDSVDSLKNCTRNGDCGEGFYCGNTVNPILHGAPVNITQHDKLDDGLTMKFCYKDPTFDDTKFIIAFNASKIGLPICNGDLECVGMGAICYQYGESKDSLNADDMSKGRGICVKVMPISRGVVSLCGALNCTTVDDCSGDEDVVYQPQCIPLGNANTTNGSLCCFTPRMCEHGTARTPRVSCSSSADCNVGTTGPWTSWCDNKGYCCHDTNGTVQHLCPDRATLIFNEPPCEGTCENGTCINGRCCPGLVIEDNVAKLGISPYITKMPCDHTIPLPDHIRFSYCSPDGFVTVIGSNDAFGEQFLLSREKECQTNADCEQEGDMILCIRGNTTSSSCNKDPFRYYKEESSSLNTTIIVCIVIIVVILVVALIAIILSRKKLILKFNKLKNKNEERI